jgi:tetratricopeptide (TPR) repeat protein
MSTRYAPLLPAALACLVYLNSFGGTFQFDDYNVIVNNGAVYSWSAWSHDLSHGIRPVLKFTYVLNWTSGLGLLGFHLLNLLIHATNTVFVYFISRRITQDFSSEAPALFAALLFAVHPVQTEAVAYISGRSTSLMATFYLGSLLAYIRGSDAQGHFWSHGVSPVLFIMGLLTKEIAITLPAVLLLWELAFGERKQLGAILKRQIIHWGLFAFALFFLIAHPGYGPLLEYSFDIRSLRETLLSQINGVFYLLSKLIVPYSLNIDPDLPVMSQWTVLLVLKAGLLLALICAGLMSLKRSPVFGFGVLWFFIVLLPTNSLIPRLDLANERQLYLSSWGLFLVIAVACAKLQVRAGKNWVYWTMAAVWVVLAGGTISRNQVYRSEIALWEDTASKSPHKPRAFNNLGYAYALAGRNEDAAKAYRKALYLNPDYKPARINLESLRKTLERD